MIFEKLAQLPDRLRLAFALLCATRIDPAADRLDRLWRELGDDAPPAAESTDDGDVVSAPADVESPELADHADAAVTYAARTRVTADPHDAAAAARHVFEAAQAADPAAGERELARQVRDLDELAELAHTAPGLPLTLMRLRSEDERASFLDAPAPVGPPLADAVALIRRDPKRFFAGDAPSPAGLITWLARDLLDLGRGSCTIRNVGSWWILGSDVDWLWHERFSPIELFARVVADPRRADDDLRAEILATAFATSVWITHNGTPSRIQGDAPPPSVWDATADLHRAIVFAM